MNRHNTDWLLYVIGGAIGLAAVTDGLARLVTGWACGRVTMRTSIAGLQALAGDVSGFTVPAGCEVPVTGIRVGAAVLLALAGAGAVAVAVWWSRWRQSDAYFVRELKRRPGFARSGEVRRSLGPAATARKARYLRSALTGKPTPADAGWKVGQSRGVDAYVSIEDSVIVVGPPRSGKGLRFVINAILDWRGPLLTTSTRNDNLAATHASRKARGDVAVFDPQGLSGMPSVHVSPIFGCRDTLTATQRAGALIGASGIGMSGTNQEWADTARSILARLLHAAALAGRDVADLSRWAQNPHAAAEAADILTQDGPAGWGETLQALIGGDQKMLANQWFGVSGALQALQLPAIRDVMTTRGGAGFDVAEFLTGQNTLYMIGTRSGSGAAGPFLAALMDDVVETARRKALTQKDSRLDPPLGLILDEIANIFAWPALPTIMADGGGIGISPLVVLQARTQAETAWSAAEMHSVFTAATAKLILGGSTDTAFLHDLEQLFGHRTVTRHGRTYSDGSISNQYGQEERLLVSADEMRRMPQSIGLLSYRTLRPILLDLQAWTDRTDAKQIRAGKRDAEAAQQAEFAARAASRP